MPLDSEEERSDLQLTKAEYVKTLSAAQHKIYPYKTFKRGQPAVRKEVDVSLQTSDEQRKQAVMHTFSSFGHCRESIPANEQKVGSYTGFQAHVHDFVVKSTAYYFLTFPKPPQKSVVHVHEVMCRMIAAAEHISMPFIRLVGDQPVYALIVELKNEKPKKFDLILPFISWPISMRISP